jgi:hypothetical protein
MTVVNPGDQLYGGDFHQTDTEALSFISLSSACLHQVNGRPTWKQDDGGSSCLYWDNVNRHCTALQSYTWPAYSNWWFTKCKQKKKGAEKVHAYAWLEEGVRCPTEGKVKRLCHKMCSIAAGLEAGEHSHNSGGNGGDTYRCSSLY